MRREQSLVSPAATQTQHNICLQISPWCWHPPKPGTGDTLLNNTTHGSPAHNFPEPQEPALHPRPALHARPASLHPTSCIPYPASCIIPPLASCIPYLISCIISCPASQISHGCPNSKLGSKAEAAAGLVQLLCPSGRESQISPERDSSEQFPAVTFPLLGIRDIVLIKPPVHMGCAAHCDKDSQ